MSAIRDNGSGVVSNAMRACFLPEPELEFGAGSHIDIRFGLLNYGPLDARSPLAPHEIRLGIVGTNETIAGVREWLERCAAGVAAKVSPQPYLFPAFPGFGKDTAFASKLVFADRLERTIHEREVGRSVGLKSRGKSIVRALRGRFRGRSPGLTSAESIRMEQPAELCLDRIGPVRGSDWRR